VILPELTKFDQNWPVARFRIVSDLRGIADVDTVEFVEVWSSGKKKEAADGEGSEAEPETEKKPAAKKAPAKKKDDDGAAEKKPAAKKAPAKKKAE
jgi:hypothetical protein